MHLVTQQRDELMIELRQTQKENQDLRKQVSLLEECNGLDLNPKETLPVESEPKSEPSEVQLGLLTEIK